MSAVVTLTTLTGSLAGQSFEFRERAVCIVGRARDCSLQLPSDRAHKSVSRYHCLLDINPPAIRVRDFGSRHGTFINDRAIGKRRADQSPAEGAQLNFPEYDLRDGDELRLSQLRLRVSIQDPTRPPTQDEAWPPSISIPSLSELPDADDMVVAAAQRQPTTAATLQIPGYQIQRSLGRGGFGEVYLARCEATGLEVALKVLRSQVAASRRAVERFWREIDNLRALQHPHIVQLLDSGQAGDYFYFTMPYCPGGSLAQLLAERYGQLTVPEALPIVLQVLDALDYAHQVPLPNIRLADGSLGEGRGLVHRDLKPSNILLDLNGGDRVVKVADFGLAKSFDQAGLSGQTMTGAQAGTPLFMPRQQVLNFKYAQPEVDVWACAACLYNLLTGCYPRNFQGRDPFLAVLQTQVAPVRARNASIPPALAAVIDRALIDQPEIYFKSAAEFKAALLAAQDWPAASSGAIAPAAEAEASS